MRKTLQILMIFIVVCSSSSHLAVLQAVAWTGMLVENVQSGDDLEDAVAKTFDGEHPCGLCHLVEDATKSGGEEKEEAPLPTVQVLDLKLLPLDRVALLPPAPVRLGMEFDDLFSVPRAFVPAVPPPRVA